MANRRRRGNQWSRKKRTTTVTKKTDVTAEKDRLLAQELEEGDASAATADNEESWENVLEKIYSTVGESGAFSSSPQKLQRVMIDKYGIHSVSQKQIKEWLRDKYSHSLHKRARIRFPRNPIVATDIDEQWQGDLLFMKDLAKFNKGFGIAFVVIDVVSRHAWGELMKDKSAKETTEAFKKILQRAHPRKPKRLQTDKGTEFLNKQFQDVLKKNDIDFFTTFSDYKAAIAERFIQTLKTLVYKYLDENYIDTFYDKFQDIINTYNKTVHSRTKFAPADVTQENVGHVLRNLYGHMWKSGDYLNMKKIKFKVGDYVRLSKIHSGTFRKSYKGNFTEEIFQVASIKHSVPYVTYGIKDLQGKEILGSYYEQELQKIPAANINKKQYWKIEKILKTRTVAGGKKEFLVKWLNYDDSFNSWISADKVKRSERAR